MYKVIKYFTDLQDNDCPYKEGDIFPRKGVEVSEERLAELSGSNNRRKEPLIKLEKVAAAKATVTEDTTVAKKATAKKSTAKKTAEK